MGWQDRDYARWTDAERRRFLATAAAARPAGHGRFGLRRCAGVAVLASAAVLALGHLPRGHPLLPALRLPMPFPHASSQSRALGKIALPPEARVGTTLTLAGSDRGKDGQVVVVEGAYRDGWQVMGRSELRHGTYSATVRLRRVGVLHLRVLHPDGARAVGSIRVR